MLVSLPLCWCLLQLGIDRPVFLLDEGFDFALAVNNQAHGDTLHAPGGQAIAHFLPQQFGHVVAHQPVEDAPRLLRVDEVHVNVARVAECVLNGGLGDFVEDDALDLCLRLVIQFGRRQQMPGNRLAFAVGVGCQIDFVRAIDRVFEVFDGVALIVHDAVFRLEVVFDIDRNLRDEQVADVTLRRLDGIALAEKLTDAARLGGRFDDHQLADCTLCRSLFSRAGFAARALSLPRLRSRFWSLPSLSSRFAAFGFDALTISGLGRLAWASVAPMRNSVVPHTGHVPLMPGVPRDV